MKNISKPLFFSSFSPLPGHKKGFVGKALLPLSTFLPPCRFQNEQFLLLPHSDQIFILTLSFFHFPAASEESRILVRREALPDPDQLDQMHQLQLGNEQLHLQKTAYACQGDRLDISCPEPGDVIKVIRANYGR